MEDRTKNFAITRLDRPKSSTFGWQVRLQRRGVRYAKYFADRGHGGPDKAFEAAKVWRDALLEKFLQDDSARVCSTSPRNSSGVVGVSKVTIPGVGGNVYLFWQATWTPGTGESRRSVRFSVKRYGERKAFRMAVQARRNATGR